MAAPDYNFSLPFFPFMVISAVVGSVKRITLPPGLVTIMHTGKKNDTGDPSDATDFIVVMRDKDAAGSNVSMVATYADGVKAPIAPGGQVEITGEDIPAGRSDSSCREIQIQSVGNDARVLLIYGRYNANYRGVF